MAESVTGSLPLNAFNFSIFFRDAETARDNEWKERLGDELDRKGGDSAPPATTETSVDPFADPNDFDAFPMPYTRPDPKIGRNDLCPCGSGNKYKKCCLGKT